ncbi:MAG: NADP oxidoreductase [Planctomycetes bacterium]|nr:NADP oxidoreductase [Planctomycetota bacterium]NOG53781.1 NADP oxidoreductase [Planctomycetota bacterium]
MTPGITFTIDGKQVTAAPGQTIIEAADTAGIYIPRLCHKPGLEPFGSCRLCTVTVGGRPCSSCTQPAAEGIVVESDTDELNEHRRALLEMLFVEGNHFCMFCEKSGNCELQALAYKFGITAPSFTYQWQKHDVDASHPQILIDRNRCILCARCVRASQDLDGKSVFGFVGRGPNKRLAVNAEARLSDTNVDVTDEALDVCPVGALLRKHVGYKVPIGKRQFDHTPIGSDVEGEPAPDDCGCGGAENVCQCTQSE